MEVDEKSKLADLPWGCCTADPETCLVHSTILPKTHWSYFNSIEEVDALISSLNPRGFREKELKERLDNERAGLARAFKKFNSSIEAKLSSVDEVVKEEPGDENHSSIDALLNLNLRDQILEFEEKVYLGALGTLKVKDRKAWQEALQGGGYDRQCDGVSWGGRTTPFESRVASEIPSRDQVRKCTCSIPVVISARDIWVGFCRVALALRTLRATSATRPGRAPLTLSKNDRRRYVIWPVRFFKLARWCKKSS